jgi:hypothetical protein
MVQTPEENQKRQKAKALFPLCGIILKNREHVFDKYLNCAKITVLQNIINSKFNCFYYKTIKTI